jgi:hypothetical protein
LEVNEKTIVFIFLKKGTYSKIVSEVIFAKRKCSTPLDYRRLKRFDILKVSDEEKLIVPLKPGETNIQYYVTNDEFFVSHLHPAARQFCRSTYTITDNTIK